MDSDRSDDDERDYSQGEELYYDPNNNNFLPEGEEIDVNDFPVPDYDEDDGLRYQPVYNPSRGPIDDTIEQDETPEGAENRGYTDYYDPREEYVDLLQLFMEHFDDLQEFVEIAQRRTSTLYEFNYPTPGNFYLVISFDLVHHHDLFAVPSDWDVVENSTSHIGQLSSMTFPDFLETKPAIYTFSKLCKLKNIENGKIIGEECKKGVELRGSLSVGDRSSKVYCLPIRKDSIDAYFSGFEQLTKKARKVATVALAINRLPDELSNKILTFAEPDTPGLENINLEKYKKGPTTRKIQLRSTAETRELEPGESRVTEEEFEKMDKTKHFDTKAGRKTKRKRRRTTRKSRKNKRKHTRRHK